MNDPLSRFSLRVAYAANQLPRLAWYAGHDVVFRRLATRARETGRSRRPLAQSSVPAPGEQRIYADMFNLLQQDLANVEAGIYPLPHDHDSRNFHVGYDDRRDCRTRRGDV